MTNLNRILFWPYVRYGIEQTFRVLLDEEWRRRWSDPKFKHAFWDNLSLLFDDTLNSPAEIFDNEGIDAIGVSLYNKEEGKKISKYLNFYNDTFEAEMPDSYYINHPKWNELLDGAKEVLEMMEANDRKYNLEHDLEEWDKFIDSDQGNDIYDKHLAECRRIALDGAYPSASDNPRGLVKHNFIAKVKEVFEQVVKPSVKQVVKQVVKKIFRFGE